MKLNKFKQLIREEIQTTLSEISPELFKRAMDVSNKKTQQKRYDNPKVTGNNTRLERMGRTYFRNFIGKELLNGKIIDVKVSNMGGDHDYVLIFVEKPEETGYGRMQTFVVNYRIDKDLFAGEIVNMPMTRRDARILGQIAAAINPETKYRDYNMFTISGDIEEGLGDMFDKAKSAMGFGPVDGMLNTFYKDGIPNFPSATVKTTKGNSFIEFDFDGDTYSIPFTNIGYYGLVNKTKGKTVIPMSKNNEKLNSLFAGFLLHSSKTKPEEGAEQVYNQAHELANTIEGKKYVNEGMFKKAALAGAIAANLMGSPQAQASGNQKDKIEYIQNTGEKETGKEETEKERKERKEREAARKKEILKAFIEFLKANRAGRIDALLQQAKEASNSYSKDNIYEEILDDFMKSDENLPVGITYAEFGFLKQYLKKITR